MYQGKRILNIDQTPINDSNLCDNGWMLSNMRWSKNINIIWPRITMVTAIDTYGEVYYSLLQANSNNHTFELFLFYLVRILDKQRPAWRKDTIVLLDGAVWHTSKGTMDVLEKFNIPTMISGPYSYDGSAIELFFSCLKRGNLNQDEMPVTKSKYIILFLILVEYL